jgi:Holliday junction DNA helicase RuvA
VAAGDVARLSAIPGVGRKTAERLVLEMKDKLKDLGAAEPRPPLPAEGAGTLDDALSALMNLGYKRPQAELALRKAQAGFQGEKDLEHLIRECLKIL